MGKNIINSMANSNSAGGLVEPLLPPSIQSYTSNVPPPPTPQPLSTFLASLDEMTGHTEPGPFLTSFLLGAQPPSTAPMLLGCR